MRNYLLASAALLGLSAGAANAALIQPATGADYSPNATSAPSPAPNAHPDPGKVVVHLGGWVAIIANVGSTSLDTGSNGTKADPYTLQGFMHYYMGVDSQTSNGLIFGGRIEVRNNGATPGAASGAGTNAGATTFYTRRTYMYLGGANWGLIRFGVADNLDALWLGRTSAEDQSRGGWDGDIIDMFGNANLTWAFGDNSNGYTSNRFVYVTPSFSGFSGGFTFTPNNTALNTGGGFTSAFNSNGDRQQISVAAADLGRPRDTFQIGAKYDGAVGPASVYAEGFYTSGSTVKFIGVAPGLATSYHGLNYFDLGLSVGYAGAYINANFMHGKFNGQNLAEPNTPHSTNGSAFVVGPEYVFGPFKVGGQFYFFDHTGSASLSPTVGAMHEEGVSVGGTWNLGPGLDLMADAVYGTRHQRGINFETSASTLGATHNTTTARGVGLTVNVRW